MDQFLHFSYWFDIYTTPFKSGLIWAFVAVFAVAVVFGIYSSKKFAKEQDRIQKIIWLKFKNISLSFGLVGFMWLFFKQAQALYIGMRIWFLVWLVICLVWLGFIVRYLIVNVPKMREEKRKRAELKKYLP